jgi:hypothetical protein
VAKGQSRGNREPKKPKSTKTKAAVAPPTATGSSSKDRPGSRVKAPGS